MWAPEKDLASIVMIGSFNPAIFQPRWLGTQQLIRKEEAENAKITTIREEIADFSTEWFNLQVVGDRLQLRSTDPMRYGPLRDLASGILTLLPHTPVKAIGMNRHFHFSIPSIDLWHGIGHLLAPKDSWNAILEKPGLLSMRIRGYRSGTDRLADGTPSGRDTSNWKIEPSTVIGPGLFVELNEEFTAPDGSQGAEWGREVVMKQWDQVMSYAEESTDHFKKLVGI
jgi:hypothetical protein